MSKQSASVIEVSKMFPSFILLSILDLYLTYQLAKLNRLNMSW